MITPPPTLASSSPKTWQVGTLTYDRRGLTRVFFWLLWGDLVLTLMDGGVVSKVIQLQLKALGASNATIGFLDGTVTALLSAVGVAVISTASDRHRGPRGRRMPFMLYSAPPLAVCLIALGFAPQLAALLDHSAPPLGRFFGSFAAHILPGIGGLSASVHLILAVMTTLLVLYRVAELFPGTVYYCVWADVLPPTLIGAFTCCFRIVAALASYIFNQYLLGYADTHPGLLYIGAGLLYLVSFTAMSLMVREGDYPPPPPRDESRRLVRRIADWARESYSIGFYWKFFIMAGSFIIAVKSLGQFVLLYGKGSFGMTSAQVGTVLARKDLIILIPFFALAPIIDRFHPLRAGIVALFGTLVCGIVSFFVIRGPTSFGVMITLTLAMVAIYQAATGAINVRILPRERYGQFNSANVMIWQLSWALAAVLCGWFLDWVKDYRYLMLWFSFFTAVSFVMTLIVYRDWKNLGGDEGYEPPLPGGRSGARRIDEADHIFVPPVDAIVDQPTLTPP